MKLITRDIDYAVRALNYIAQNGNGIITVAHLAKELKIPRPFLRKILQILNREGLLHSYKGKNGGFQLALEPGKIFLVDLIEMFQGPLELSNCLFKKKICPDAASCILKSKIAAIERRVISDLKCITMELLLH